MSGEETINALNHHVLEFLHACLSLSSFLMLKNVANYDDLIVNIKFKMHMFAVKTHRELTLAVFSSVSYYSTSRIAGWGLTTSVF